MKKFDDRSVAQLTQTPFLRSRGGMSSAAQEQNFQDYKRAEKKALEIVAEMKTTTPKKVDIEVALLVAFFELHKGSAKAAHVAGLIQGHVKELVAFYAAKERV